MSIINEIITLLELEPETEISPIQLSSFKKFIESTPSFDPYAILKDTTLEENQSITFARLLFEVAIFGNDDVVPLLKILAEKGLLTSEDYKALQDINYYFANILLSEETISAEALVVLEDLIKSQPPLDLYYAPDPNAFGRQYPVSNLVSSLLKAYGDGKKEIWPLLHSLINKGLLKHEDQTIAENIFNKNLVQHYQKSHKEVIDLSTLYQKITRSFHVHKENPMDRIKGLKAVDLDKRCKIIERFGATSAGRAILNEPVPGDKDKKTLLHVVALVTHPNGRKLLATLLKAGAKPNIQATISAETFDYRHGEGSTPLHNAVSAGNIYAVRKLLKAGADPLIKNAYGETADDLLFCDKDEYLFNKFEFSRNRKDLTTLFYDQLLAQFSKRLQALATNIETDPQNKKNYQELKDFLSQILKSSWNYDYNVSEVIQPNQPVGSTGMPLLHLVITHCPEDIDLVKLLLDIGADPTVKNINGQDAESLRCEKWKDASAELDKSTKAFLKDDDLSPQDNILIHMLALADIRRFLVEPNKNHKPLAEISTKNPYTKLLDPTGHLATIAEEPGLEV